MSTLIHKLDNGVVLNCGNCSSPIRYFYFTHICEYRCGSGTCKIYCMECLKEKGDCKHCKKKYIMKAQHSL